MRSYRLHDANGNSSSFIHEVTSATMAMHDSTHEFNLPPNFFIVCSEEILGRKSPKRKRYALLEEVSAGLMKISNDDISNFKNKIR